jgi:6-phosphogluconolactonase (cycloisomerase 2 family)
MTPDGTHLYATNWISGTVSAFDAAPDGALSLISGSPFPSGFKSAGVGVTPDGRYAYVASVGNGNVYGYRIERDGSLTAIPGSPFAAAGGTGTVAISPGGRYLYALNTYGPSGEAGAPNNISVYRVDHDGSLFQIPGSPFVAGQNPRAEAISPDGRYLFVAMRNDNDVWVYRIAHDGSLAPIGSPYPVGNTPYGMVLSPDGARLYINNALGSSISAFTVAAGGKLTPIGTGSFPTEITADGMAMTPDGAYLYNSSLLAGGSGYAVASDGSLSAVAGSPFSSQGVNPSFQSLVITPDQGPVAKFRVDGRAVARRPTSFDAGASFDPDGTIARYDWRFGDGQSLLNGGATPTHAYARPGVYSATLKVTDNAGCSDGVVFTGTTAYCDGGRAAIESILVWVR